MGLQKRSFCLALTITLVLSLNAAVIVLSADWFSKHDFPPYFVFGAGTSAYQVEGAVNEDGRTPSIWDTFTHDGHAGGQNGDVACDGYHKYKEDVELMAKMRLDAYKFSISWSRLIPNGRGPLNTKGLRYYNNLINELLKHGIQPHVVLVHNDIPQALQDEYGGWLDRRIITDFEKYANVCFREFGDRVLHWSTVNELSMAALGGYDQGIMPPGRCSPPFGITDCSKGGNSTHEPYLAHHNMLLSHAAAVRLYRERYQDKQQGLIGITAYSFGLRPATDTEEDKLACQRAFDFFVGWDLDPIVHGDYPVTVKERAGSKLPAFTKFESEQIKGSFDFIGLIYYSNINITDNPNNLEREQSNCLRDMGLTIANTEAILSADMSPYMFQGVLETLKERYHNPPIFIHENGFLTNSNSSLNDVKRVQYIHSYIGGLLDALRNGSDVRGYFVWSFMDVFELLGGYKTSFGVYYVDRDDPALTRFPKLSARWYSLFLEGRSISRVATLDLNHSLSDISVSRFFE